MHFRLERIDDVVEKPNRHPASKSNHLLNELSRLRKRERSEPAHNLLRQRNAFRVRQGRRRRLLLRRNRRRYRYDLGSRWSWRHLGTNRRRYPRSSLFRSHDTVPQSYWNSLLRFIAPIENCESVCTQLFAYSKPNMPRGRYCNASCMCAAVTSSAFARSAIVRATRIVR